MNDGPPSPGKEKNLRWGFGGPFFEAPFRTGPADYPPAGTSGSEEERGRASATSKSPQHSARPVSRDSLRGTIVELTMRPGPEPHPRPV